jgi:hypothetical protein
MHELLEKIFTLPTVQNGIEVEGYFPSHPVALKPKPVILKVVKQVKPAPKYTHEYFNENFQNDDFLW